MNEVGKATTRSDPQSTFCLLATIDISPFHIAIPERNHGPKEVADLTHDHDKTRGGTARGPIFAIHAVTFYHDTRRPR